MQCTLDGLKLFSNILNFFYAIFGILFIIFAALKTDVPSSYAIYIYIISGIMLLAVAIGWCGICKEHEYLTILYVIIIFCLVIAHVIFQTEDEIDHDWIEHLAVRAIQKIWINEVKQPGAMDDIQQINKCCGRISPEDYTTILRMEMPASCYPDFIVNRPLLYKTGCIKATQDKLESIFNYCVMFSWFGLLFSAILCILSFYLFWLFRKQRIYFHARV